MQVPNYFLNDYLLLAHTLIYIFIYFDQNGPYYHNPNYPIHHEKRILNMYRSPQISAWSLYLSDQISIDHLFGNDSIKKCYAWHFKDD
jgi:hypothetical protein